MIIEYLNKITQLIHQDNEQQFNITQLGSKIVLSMNEKVNQVYQNSQSKKSKKKLQEQILNQTMNRSQTQESRNLYDNSNHLGIPTDSQHSDFQRRQSIFKANNHLNSQSSANQSIDQSPFRGASQNTLDRKLTKIQSNGNLIQKSSKDMINSQQNIDPNQVFQTEINQEGSPQTIDNEQSQEKLVKKRKRNVIQRRNINMNQSSVINSNQLINTSDHYFQSQSFNNSMVKSSKLSDYDALTRYMRARELAEQKAKEKIDRLNLLIDKWEKKDSKAREIINESLLEKKIRLDQMSKKRAQAKQKYEKKLEEIEQKGVKEYQSYLKELREPTNGSKLQIRNKFDSPAVNNHYHIGHQDTSSTYLLNEDKKLANNNLSRRKSETSLKLELLEKKINQGRERSFLIKQEVMKRTERFMGEKSISDLRWSQMINRSPEIKIQMEQDVASKLSQYLKKMQKHDQIMTQKSEDQRYQMEAIRQKQIQKFDAQLQIKKEYESQLDRKRRHIEQSRLRKDENVDQVKYESEIQQLIKIETSKLKTQDLKEQYEEVILNQKMRKEKIIKKHLQMNQKIMSHKNSNQSGQAGLPSTNKSTYTTITRQQDELRRFLQMRNHASPYDEMKQKYLKSMVSGKGKKNKKAQYDSFLEQSSDNINNNH
ncbi:UNKNOWN [Stylonychia lemnae]|uniref:Uncharacterized protein n=1 Tax=Stylonychia lemnae TaxID=5949 RepID=A0A077ZWF2_STYLE|nr:UNKNOWN [Stylonychia lemnae]|eukprot:CDW74194.1 UNKNOWN [Stylonychia lemnae]